MNNSAWDASKIDDYCRRTIDAGYRAVIASDAFVHHFGGRTFVGSGVDFGALMRENERRFRHKWTNGDDKAATATSPNRTVAASATLGPFELMTAPGEGLLVRPCRPRLSLCMIVRDSSRTLPACLESIHPWVDEMVIVDTGSTDETPRIVESFGGRLFHFPWCDDFSAARNESLRHARGDWLFWMDSDDTDNTRMRPPAPVIDRRRFGSVAAWLRDAGPLPRHWRKRRSRVGCDSRRSC